MNPNAAHPLLGININRLEINDIEPLYAELSDFFACIENDETPKITGEDGRRALSLAVGVLEKIAEHRKRLNF
jgi:UDP-N-acetylglucosamine 3-dehydrogenase